MKKYTITIELESDKESIKSLIEVFDEVLDDAYLNLEIEDYKITALKQVYPRIRNAFVEE